MVRLWFFVRCRWLERSAIDFGWGERGLKKGAGCSGETPFGLAGPTLFFIGAPNSPEERPETAPCTVRIGGRGEAQVIIGSDLEIIGGARAPPKRYQVPPCLLDIS